MDGCFYMKNPYQSNPEKMYTYLKAYMEGAGMKESQKALAYARKKRWTETDLLLLPVLKDAQTEYPELSNILFTLRTNIRSVNGILMFVCNTAYEKWKNVFQAPAAEAPAED